MASARAYVFVPEAPIAAGGLRVRTIESASWVAWRAIVPFSCDGSPRPDGERVEPQPAPPPPPEWELLPGRGSCDEDDDCVGDRCCQPTTCVSRRRAPDCSDVACPMMCGPLDCGRGECFCDDGRCAARRRPEPGLELLLDPAAMWFP